MNVSRSKYAKSWSPTQKNQRSQSLSASPHPSADGSPVSTPTVQVEDPQPSLIITNLICLWLLSQIFLYKIVGTSFSLDLGISLTPDRALFLTLLLVFFVLVLTGKASLKRLTFIEFNMLAFTSVCLISYVVAQPDQYFGSYRLLTTLIQFTLTPFAAFYLARCALTDKRSMKRLLTVLSILGCYLVFTAISEMKFPQLVWPRYILQPGVGINASRARGPFVDPVVLGHIITITVLAASVLWTVSKGAKKLTLVAFILVAPTAVYFTSTRSVWLALAVAFLITTLFKTKLRFFTKLISVAVLLTVLAGPARHLSLWQPTLFSTRQNTVDYRIANYAFAWEVFQTNPVFGIGYGNLVLRLGKLQSTASADVFYDGVSLTDGNHNTFLGLLAEVGLIGFTPYVLILILLVFVCWKQSLLGRAANSTEFDRLFSVITFAALLVYLLVGQFIDLRFHSLPTNLSFLLAGIVFGRAAGAGDPKPGLQKSQPGPRLQGYWKRNLGIANRRPASAAQTTTTSAPRGADDHKFKPNVMRSSPRRPGVAGSR